MADNQTDHDLLIKLTTTVDSLVQMQKEFNQRQDAFNREMQTRITVLERKDSGDSQRFKSISDEIKRSLDNASKIEKLVADVNNLGEKVREVHNKSLVLDGVNAAGATLAGVIGYFFGAK